MDAPHMLSDVEAKSDQITPSSLNLLPHQSLATSNLLYSLLHVLHSLFTDAAIAYSLDGGSTLGLIRHGGIIPWDDDADCVVFECDRERISKEIVQKVNRHHENRASKGQAALSSSASSFTSTSASSSSITLSCPLSSYEFIPMYFGWKFCHRSSPLIPGRHWRYPSVDIFMIDLPKVDEGRRKRRKRKVKHTNACSSDSIATGVSSSISSSSTTTQSQIGPSFLVPHLLHRLPFSSVKAQKCFGYMNWYAHEMLQSQPSNDNNEIVDEAKDDSSENEDDDDQGEDSDGTTAVSSPVASSYSSSATTLKLHQFGPLRLFAPPHVHIESYLTRCYGSSWSYEAVRTYDHENEKKLTSTQQQTKTTSLKTTTSAPSPRVTLQPSDLVPAPWLNDRDWSAPVQCTCSNGNN